MGDDQTPIEEAKIILESGIERWHSFSEKERKSCLTSTLEELEKLD